MKTLRMFYILILVTSLFQCVAKAEFIFGEPNKVSNINSTSYDTMPYISSDGLELYFQSNRPYGSNVCYSDIWVSRRSTTGEPWNEPVKLDPPVNTDGPEGSPCISTDGLELYFSEGWFPLYEGNCETRQNGYGGGDLWVSKRATKDDPWGEPENLGIAVNTSETEDTPSISADGLSLYFFSNRAGGINIFVTTRQTKDDPWEPAKYIGSPINTGYYESVPRISPDGLSLFFSVGGYLTDIYVSQRPDTTSLWTSKEIFDPVNSPGNEYAISYTTDCSTLYFARGNDYFSTGTYDIWQLDVMPIVDLNSDGIVDSADMCIIVDNWHTENTLCDIGPAPLGDGFVDIQDLIVLAEHLFEEIPPAE